jgi:HAD superfamily hydrolase (TIGR01484 family)
MKKDDIWLLIDLDRTLLPNGRVEESPLARPLFLELARRPQLHLVYVSGRHEGLLKQAISNYDLPVPDYAIGDVGTTIFEPRPGGWHHLADWEDEISRDWHGRSHADLTVLLADFSALRLQESAKQNAYKLSYYTVPRLDYRPLLAAVRQRLEKEGVRASLVYSTDEMKEIGLLDVLPEKATKMHAIRFLLHRQGISERRAVYAGDSGNDLPVLTSGLQAILVRNASEAVRQEALEKVKAKGLRDRLYLARGNIPGLNGNYAAGVLEGVAHFFPEVRHWLQKVLLERSGKLCR